MQVVENYTIVWNCRFDPNGYQVLEEVSIVARIKLMVQKARILHSAKATKNKTILTTILKYQKYKDPQIFFITLITYKHSKKPKNYNMSHSANVKTSCVSSLFRL
jgi:hypothetical protein